MNPEENEKRIIYLSNKYRDSDINSIKDDYIEFIQYLKNNCELCLRLILKKHYNGEPLSEEEQEKINKYLFFSNPKILIVSKESQSKIVGAINVGVIMFKFSFVNPRDKEFAI